MPTWDISARTPIRMAWIVVVLPGLDPQLSGPGRLRARQSGRGHQSLLSDGAVLGADPARRAGDPGHRHREPGGHHRRLLDRPAGDLARPPAAHEHHPHQRDRAGPDLYRPDQLAAASSASILLVLVFGSSSNLASAYGIAVNTSMIIDTILALIFFWKARNLPVGHRHPAARRRPRGRSSPSSPPTALKLTHGGYMPVLIGAIIIVTMLTWMRGRRSSPSKLRKDSVELVGLLRKRSNAARRPASPAPPYSCRPIPSMRRARSCTI